MERTLRPRDPVQYYRQQEDVRRQYDVQLKFQEQQDYGFVSHMKAEDFTLKYIQENGLQQPLVFEDAKELGLKVPPSSLTVRDVKSLVGSRRQVDVMELHSQDTHTMTMSQWTKYFEIQPRQQVLNVISLEFSHTELDPLVQPPTLVRALDWVELMWPQELKNAQNNPTNDLNQMMYPKVQKYCLMSVAGCYTDFHLDFGGSSVWYHVLWGEKLFLLIPPTPQNYTTFQGWQLSGMQDIIFLGDLIPQCQLVRLRAGDTFILPAGWIHAVYTPVDSLVFGGNFLHSFNIPQQMGVAEVERATKVPDKCLYPFYGAIHWYALLRYSEELRRMGVEAASTVSQEGHGKVGTSKSSVVSESSSGTLCSPKWLKSVSVHRLPLQPFRKRKWLKCVLVEKICTVTRKVNQVKQDLHSSSSTASTKPHLSRYEQKGLLALIHAMRHMNLFHFNVPSCIPNPSHLLDALDSQLRSSALRSVCSPTPTGIAVIRPPLTQERKNGVKRRSKTHPSSMKVKKHKDDSCVPAELVVVDQSQQAFVEVTIATDGTVVQQTSDVLLEPAFESTEVMTNPLLEAQHSDHGESSLPNVELAGNQTEGACKETRHTETCGVSGIPVQDETSYTDTDLPSSGQSQAVEGTQPPTNSSSFEMQEYTADCSSQQPLSNGATPPAALVQQSSVPSPPQMYDSQHIKSGPPIEMDLLLIKALVSAASALQHLGSFKRSTPHPAQSTSSVRSGTVQGSWGMSLPTDSEGDCGGPARKNKRKPSQPQHYTTPQPSPTKSQDDSLADTSDMASLSLPEKLSLRSDFLREHAQRKTEVVYIDPPEEPPSLCSKSTTDVLLSSEDPVLTLSCDMGGSPNKGIQVEEKSSVGTDFPERSINNIQSGCEPFEHEGTTDTPLGSETLLCGGSVTPQLLFRTLGSSPCKSLQEPMALHSPCGSRNST